MNKTAIIIPSRMSASRLAGKPLLKINNLPIICHVVNKAREANIGEVYVATEDQEIVDVVRENGGKAVLTGKHATGSDRIFEGYKKLNLTGINYLINLQGDEPMINPEDIINLNNKMIENNINIGTLGTDLKNDSILENENVVKVVTEKKLDANNFAKAKNFFRKNSNDNNLNVYHHIGVYAYNVSTLEKFISLQQTKNEIQKRLEQLRALDNNIDIMVVLAKSSPIGVDTKEDFLAIKKIMEYKS
jgi:3-deoxy-manno-octulosonate cytidylyltransferase (CMP-KDO synthetase)